MTDHTPDNCHICQTFKKAHGKIVILPPTGRVFVNGKWEAMASEWFGHDGKPMSDPWTWTIGPNAGESDTVTA